jgi:hypothetical protein
MRHKWFKPKTEYIDPNEGDGNGADPFAEADLRLTQACAATLELHYPGHPWLIEASHQQGVVYISIPIFTGRNKYVIHINVLKVDPGLRHVVRAGGEILERFKIPRQRFSVDNYVNALNAMPLHRRGRGMRELR